MELFGFFLYFGLFPENPELLDINFSENIEYCTNIVHNPNMEDEFNKNCNLEEVNNYVMIVKRGL